MALLEVFATPVGRCVHCGIISGVDRFELENRRGCRFSPGGDSLDHAFDVKDMNEVMADANPHLPRAMSPEWVASIWITELWPDTEEQR